MPGQGLVPVAASGGRLLHLLADPMARNWPNSVNPR
jgi:hypothetical protein